MQRISIILKILWQAYQRFTQHDAWALASHIAMSLLMALFPFLISVTSLATFLGADSLSDGAVQLIIETWPKEIAIPIAREVHNVLTVKRTDILTIGFILSLYFSSSGVESLRIGLTRAYGARENRNWFRLRAGSIVAVIFGAVAMLSFAFLVILGPLVWNALIGWFPKIREFGVTITFLRFGTASILFIVALCVAHWFLPPGRRSFFSLLPGIFVTIFLWLLGGIGFGWYLARFSQNYASMYGSLATAMMSLVFLYLFAAIFLYGGELNGILLTPSSESDSSRQKEDVS